MKSVFNSIKGKELEKSGLIGNKNYWDQVKNNIKLHKITLNQSRQMVEFSLIGKEFSKCLDNLNKVGRSLGI